jgi:hypothetical protein
LLVSQAVENIQMANQEEEERKDEMTRIQKNILDLAVAVAALLCGMMIPANGQAQAQRQVKQPSLGDGTIQGRLAALQEYYQYPPGSKAIDSSYWDYLHPWNVETQPRAVISQNTLSQIAALQNAGVGSNATAKQLQPQLQTSPFLYKFDMNKTILAGTGDQLQARLTITPARSSDPNPTIHISSAELIGSPEFGSPNLGTAPFSCETTGSSCTFTWQAPSAEKKYWGALTLRVTLMVDGIKDSFVVGQGFYSSPIVAGKFTGTFRERLENGSLVVDAGVEVQKHMACFVRANLFATGNGSPLQHVERRMLVDPSMKTISLTFFGKIFRDYGDQGAFRVQDLQAACENLPYPAEWFIDQAAHEADWRDFQKNPPATREPRRIYFEYDTHSYTTRSYALSAFSNDEWQSPEKTQVLEAHRRLAAQTK